MGVRNRQDNELHVAPLGSDSNEVSQGRDELRLLGKQELVVVDVEPHEEAKHGGLQMRSFEEQTKLSEQD